MGNRIISILPIQNYIQFLIQSRKIQIILFYRNNYINTVQLRHCSKLYNHYISDFNHSFKSLSFRNKA